jgi:hypothetical protein
MHKKYFIHAFLAVGLFYPSATYGVGLGVGVFGGYAVPTGDMAAEEGFDLRPSTALGVRAFFNIHKHFGADLAAAYNFNFPPGKKEYQWADITELLPINVGGYYKVDVGSIRFSAGGGVGYYFLKTKLASTVKSYDSGFGNVRYPVELSINAPGIYAGAGASYLLGKFAFTFAPRFNYVFNEGTYEGAVEYGAEPTVPVHKDWDDSYFEVSAGIIYGLF